MVLAINPNTILIDPKTGKLTRDGVRFFSELIDNLTFTGAIVGTTDTQTLTNKTIDGDLNTIQDIATSSLKTRTGTSTHVVTSDDSGTPGNVPQWDSNQDLVDSGVVAANIIQDTAIGVTVQPWGTNLDNHNQNIITGTELSADPADPAEGSFVVWQSDGTGTGDDGDWLIKLTAGGVTKTATLADFSAL